MATAPLAAACERRCPRVVAWVADNPRKHGGLYLVAMFVLMWIFFISNELDCVVSDDDLRQHECKYGVGYATYLSTWPPITGGCEDAAWDEPRVRMLCSRWRSALLGIPFSWLCHKSWQHIAANSLFFLLYGGFILLRFAGARHFLLACFWSQLATGLTWFTRGGCGASGMIFGLFAFMMSMGLMKALGMPPMPEGCCTSSSCGGCCGCFCSWLSKWSKRWMCEFSTVGDLVISIVLIIVFRAMFWGFVPSDEKVSWEGHVFGFLGGAGYAAFLARRERRRISAKRTAQPPTGPPAVIVHSTTPQPPVAGPPAPAATTMATINPFLTKPPYTAAVCVHSNTPQPPAAGPPAPAATTTTSATTPTPAAANPFLEQQPSCVPSTTPQPEACAPERHLGPITNSAPTQSAGYRL